ncbi:MAG: indole-3-glycerol phosphate synthase TrpC [Acidobacteria bacterium]|nr:indole-3-glycerol phosphate synthase TrpC [Acidobacteriota bacterium]MBI3483640.1 indole-3-glycerol phosphate synthase TrpC [Acidobacteriota bacterium]
MQAQPKTGTILDRIVEARRAAVEHRQKVVPLPVLKLAVKRNESPRDFAAALSRPALNVIAELKKASPSRGVLREDFSVEALAAALEQAGAAALSVLTEEQFFQGALVHVTAARKKTALPVLRKDFIFNAWQVWEARAAEADSFLLIAAILDDALLRELLLLGRELGMEALVEVHTREELRRAADTGARIVGINNRDLRTFEVRVETSLELIEEIPDECIAVSESGLRAHADLERLRVAGFDAFLVGEQLMTAAEPGAALRELMGT